VARGINVVEIREVEVEDVIVAHCVDEATKESDGGVIVVDFEA
jgi:hypothetical protein